MTPTENDCSFVTEFKGSLLYNEPLAEYTTWRVGGPDGEIRIRKPEEYEVAYRHVSGPPDEWFISATFKLQPGDKETSLQVINDLLADRANTQPTSEYNCGSVFRNPPENYAARLIESCGLKGVNVGGAVVSQKHANFIINHQGTATAADIEALIDLVQTKVREQTSIELMREVHIIGDR